MRDEYIQNIKNTINKATSAEKKGFTTPKDE